MTKKELVLRDHNLGLLVKEIAKKHNFKESSVRGIINNAGLKSNKSSPGNNLDHKFQEFILGSMLGDGSLQKDNRLSIAHCETQKEYIKEKHKIMSSYNLAGKLSHNTIINDRYKNGLITEYRFKTLSTDKMNGMRQFYYPYGIKTVPSEEFLFEFLTPLALAIWFMDDGSVCLANFQINSQGFTVAEVNSLRYVLLEKYGIQSTCTSDHAITIRSKSLNTFTSIVSPYMCKTMKYKLVTLRNRVLNKLGELQERCDANLQPSLSSNTLEGSTTNDRIQKMDSNIDTSTQHLTIGDDIVCSIENKESIELEDKEPLS